MSLSTKILIGLVAGIATGLFFGESATLLAPVGTAFVRLMQMSVLPYVAVSLIAALGDRSLADARRLASRAGLVLLVIWIITVATVLLMPQGYPDWEKSSFFSPSLLNPPKTVEFVELYVPNNPFESLAGGLVPAVVLFSIMLGIALMSVPNKQELIGSLRAISAALTKISGMVVRLAPIGVFAITAGAAGTMSVEQLADLNVYMLVYVASWTVLTFVLLPLLVTWFTPLGYRQVLGATKDVLITAFATGSVFVVLTLLSQRVTELLESTGMPSKEAHARVDVIVPTAFSLPSAGTLLALGFVQFSAWASDASLSAAQQAQFAAVGPASFFSSPLMAMPFLLDFLHLPADFFQQFVISDVLTSRFGMMLAAMHMIVLGLLGSMMLAGTAKFSKRRIFRYALLVLVLPIGSILAARTVATLTIDREYRNHDLFIEMKLLAPPVEAFIKSEVEDHAAAAPASLEEIIERGILRVGYSDDALPFVFVNAQDELVGHDIELAHRLAEDLGIGLDLVHLQRDQLFDALNTGRIDIGMSGIAITADRARRVSFSTSYFELTLALIVPDHQRKKYAKQDGFPDLAGMRVGVPDDPYFMEAFSLALPLATIVPVTSPVQFFEPEGEPLDVQIGSAEAGSAWCLLYPQYTIVVPSGGRVRVPLAFPVALDNGSVLRYLDTWIDLRERDGTLHALFEYWIQGQGATNREPRWCVIRDVLHWIE